MKSRKKKTLKHRLTAIALMTILALNSLFSHRYDSYFMSKSVKLVSDRGSCSGQQVTAASGSIYILTAAHCLILARDGSITALTEDGRRMQRRVIAEDINSDLALLEGVPLMPGLEIADKVSRGDHVRTYTHGSGFPTYKTEGQIIDEKQVQVLQEITQGELTVKCDMPKNKKLELDTAFGKFKACIIDTMGIVTDARIVPGSSGGMVVSDSGKLVGVVSAGNDAGFGFLVDLKDIQNFLSNY